MIPLLEPMLSDFKDGTVAYALQWRIDESDKPGARRIAGSRRYTLRRLQREAIGRKIIAHMKPQDLVDHCRSRIAAGIKPQSVSQDLSSLRSTIRDYVESKDLPQEWLLVFAKTKRLLEKDQLIGKSTPRERLPMQLEIDLILAYFEKQNAHRRTTTDMVLVVHAELLTGRRISELCRIERQHVDVAKRTYWIYDLKNSKGKGYDGEAALIEGAWELFEERLRVIPNVPTARLFPFNSHTCSQRYTIAKKELQKKHPDLFKNLRMHDNRAQCFVALMDKGYSALRIRKGVSLHRGPAVFENSYARIKAVDLHKGPQSERGAP